MVRLYSEGLSISFPNTDTFYKFARLFKKTPVDRPVNEKGRFIYLSH